MLLAPSRKNGADYSGFGVAMRLSVQQKRGRPNVLFLFKQPAFMIGRFAL